MGCNSTKVEQHKYSIKSNQAQHKVSLYDNDNLVFEIEKRSILWPYEPTLAIDSVNHVAYLNVFKSSIIAVDLKQKKKIGEVNFKATNENSEKSCNIYVIGDYVLFSSALNLIVLSKDLKKSFNAVDKICNYDASICRVESISFNKIDSSAINVDYKINGIVAKQNSLSITLNESDSINLYNIPVQSALPEKKR